MTAGVSFLNLFSKLITPAKDRFFSISSRVTSWIAFELVKEAVPYASW
jgi:hypothetical protein